MKKLNLTYYLKNKTFDLLKRSIFLFLFLMLSVSLNAQLVFSESFDEIEGSTSGVDNTSGVNWSTACPTCVDAGDFFKVVAGELVGQDSNGPATFSTGAIDISNCNFFDISLVLKEEGTLEACGTGCTSVDWVQLEYNIDNTGWQTPTNSSFCSGGCAGINVIHSDDINGTSLNYSTGCIEGGSSLQLRISVQAWAASERWILDDVNVSCATGPTINGGGDQTLCGGDVTLTASNPDNGILSWNNGIVNGVAFTPPLGVNTYVVSSDLSGCVANDTVVITVNTAPTFSILSSNPSTCNGNEGSITLSGLITNTNYQLSYTNNGVSIGPLFQNSSVSGVIVLSNLGSGTYSDFTLVLAGCSTTDSSTIILSDPPVPLINAGIDQVVCENSTITLSAVNPNNATISWDYNITDGSPFTVLSGTTTYTVTASLNGCSSSDMVTITSTQVPSVNAGNDQTLCEGDTVNLSATNPDLATISWSNGITDGVDFTPNSGQNNFIVSADLNGCIVTDTVVVNVIPLPTFNLTQQNPTVCSGTDGEIIISGLLPNNSYEYTYQSTTLQGPFIMNSSVSGVIFISNLQAGTYLGFNVTFSGCTSQNNTVLTLTDPNVPFIDAGIDQTICLGDEMILTANNPDNANVTWDNGITNGVPFLITDNQTYVVTALLNGCTNIDSVNVSVLAAPTIEAGENKTICIGDSVKLSATSSNSNFNWNNGIVDDSFFKPQLTNIYTVSTSIGSCSATDEVTVFVNQGPDASFTFTPNNPTVENTEVTFQLLNSNDINNTFNWNFGDNQTSTISEPIHIYPEEGQVTYQIDLVVTDTAGCKDTATSYITIDDLLIYYVPNAFTPDADAINNTFKPVFTSGFDIYDYHLTIFNRWDEILFESYNPNIGWNGTYIDGQNVPSGVYVWTIEFGDLKTDKRSFITGHVTLLK
jgi:gliding motility-associated-like protein